MRVLITTFLLMIFQISFFSQNSISKKIDLSNCRDGESVEYCKTHKLMNKLKEDPEFDFNGLLGGIVRSIKK